MSWRWTPPIEAKLGAFLTQHGLIEGDLAIRPLGDGHSNLTFLVSAGPRTVVVRRPPPPPLPRGAHDVLREARLLHALSATKLPVPRVLATGIAGQVFDVPFYVMNHVQGVVVTRETPEFLRLPGARRDMAFALVDQLAALHAVDWRSLGLGNFGRPEGFNARHLQRIAGLVTDAAGCIDPAFAAVHAWLAAHVPAESGASIVHNDYRLGNVLWAPHAPVRLAAILDWELATLGDPLLDVAYLLASIPQAGLPATPTQRLGLAALEPGFPLREALAARYAHLTGRDLSRLAWYLALVDWKLAAMYAYSHRRGLDAYYADPAQIIEFLSAAKHTVAQCDRH